MSDERGKIGLHILYMDGLAGIDLRRGVIASLSYGSYIILIVWMEGCGGCCYKWAEG